MKEGESVFPPVFYKLQVFLYFQKSFELLLFRVFDKEYGISMVMICKCSMNPQITAFPAVILFPHFLLVFLAACECIVSAL